jgi:hypothetical protein
MGLGFELKASGTARQVLYCLSHTSSPFCLSYFSDRVSTLCWNSLDCSPAIYASHLAAMTGMCPLGLIFESGLAWNWRSSCLRPLSAEITSVNHHTRQVLKHRMVVHAVETILRILIFSWNVGIRCYTVTVLCSGHESQHPSQVCWHTPAIPALGKQRQEDHKFQATLGYERPFLTEEKNPKTRQHSSPCCAAVFLGWGIW